MLDGVRNLFRPKLPLWACEFTSRDVIVAGVDGRRSRAQGRSSIPLQKELLQPGLSAPNIIEPLKLRAAVQEALKMAGFKGSEIAVVIPDDAARISFVNTDSLPKTPEEQQTFLRWKLKKTVPFDVDTAQIAFEIIGSPNGSADRKQRGFDML